MGKCIVLGVLLCLFQAEQTGAIEGTIQDRHGNAAAGVPVTLFRITTEGVTGAGTTETDLAGKYRFANLAVGRYVLEYSRGPCSSEVASIRSLERELANADDLPKQQQLRRSLERSRDGARAIARRHPHGVTVRPGESLTHDVHYPSLVTVRVIVEGDTLPDERFTIQLRRPNDDGGPVPPEAPTHVPEFGAPSSDSLLLGPVEVDQDDGVTFRGVVEGVQIPIVQIGNYLVTFKKHEIRGPGSHEIRLVPGPYRARFRVLDVEGQPVSQIFSGTAHHLHQTKPEHWAKSAFHVQGTDLTPAEGGMFEIPYLNAGRYVLGVEIGWPPSTTSAGLPFEVGEDSPCPEIELRSQPAGRLVVAISDPSGEPERAYYVRARRPEDGTYIAMSTTGAEGAEFRSFRAGTWTISIQPVGGEEGDETQVEIKPNETTEVTLVVQVR